ncbi:hypothetical protein MLI36_023540, partial [Escherichia coli]|nr:hypothetical protein [Escherichia coli]
GIGFEIPTQAMYQMPCLGYMMIAILNNAKGGWCEGAGSYNYFVGFNCRKVIPDLIDGVFCHYWRSHLYLYH